MNVGTGASKQMPPTTEPTVTDGSSSASLSTPSAAVVERAPPLCAWLGKLAEWRFSWDRRLVTLTGSMMAYKEKVSLPDKKVGRVRSLQAVLPSSRHAFRVWVDIGEAWTFKADDAETHERWTRAIAAALRLAESAEAETAKLKQQQQQTSGGGQRCGGDGRSSGVLEAEVLKRSYWTHSWRPRRLVLDLSDRILRYTTTVSTGDGTPATASASSASSAYKSVVLTGADLVLTANTDQNTISHQSPNDTNNNNRCDVAFKTYSGDDFHARFATADEAAAWVAAVQGVLCHLEGPCWTTLPLVHTDPITASDSPGMRRLAHASYVLPGTDHLFIFGGRHAAGFSCHDADGPTGFFPIVGGGGGSGTGTGSSGARSGSSISSSVLCPADVFHVRLSGDFVANTVHVAPFQEGPGAKIRPQPREGCASVALGSTWLIHGGRGALSGPPDGAGSAAGAVLGDVWSIDFEGLLIKKSSNTTTNAGSSSASSSSSPPPPLLQWSLLSGGSGGGGSMVAERSLPRTAFHAAAVLHDDDVCGSGDGGGKVVLFAGGTRDGVTAGCECWLLDVASGAVRETAPLPEPRMQHAMATLGRSGDVVLVGGVSTAWPEVATKGSATTTNNTQQFPPLLRSRVTGAWSRIEVEGSSPRRALREGGGGPDLPAPVHLPSLSFPAICVQSGGKDVVFFMGGPGGSVRLPYVGLLQPMAGPSSSLNTSASSASTSVISASSSTVAARAVLCNTIGSIPPYCMGLSVVAFGGFVYAVGGGGVSRIQLAALLPPTGTLI